MFTDSQLQSLRNCHEGDSEKITPSLVEKCKKLGLCDETGQFTDKLKQMLDQYVEKSGDGPEGLKSLFPISSVKSSGPNEMTVDEAIEIVAKSALLDHPPSSVEGGRFEFKPLSLEEVIASAKVHGQAGDLDPHYNQDSDNYVIEVTYSNKGWAAVYEVGPTTGPILWSD